MESLLNQGYAITPNYFTSSTVANLRKTVQKLRRSGEFRPAGVGQGRSPPGQDIRRDEICWLDDARTSDEGALHAQLERLKIQFNRELQTGICELEAHFSIYPPRGFYRRHLDRFRNDDARVVSIVIYLNEDWKPSDGGDLVIFDRRVDGSEREVLVSPQAGTLVCFLSDRIEHEVRASVARERWSIAGWFKRRSVSGL